MFKAEVPKFFPKQCQKLIWMVNYGPKINVYMKLNLIKMNYSLQKIPQPFTRTLMGNINVSCIRVERIFWCSAELCNLESERSNVYQKVSHCYINRHCIFCNEHNQNNVFFTNIYLSMTNLIKGIHIQFMSHGDCVQKMFSDFTYFTVCMF